MATTISVLSQKGGTGKTTMVRALTDVFERLGLDVLAIDADPQGNLSDYFDTEPDAEPTLAEVLIGQTRAADAIHGSVIPANLRLAEAELALAGKIGREVTLRNALRDLEREKELILIDCPPTLGLLTVNALVASDYALLSTQSQYFSLQGVEQAMEVVDLARDSLNPDLELLGDRAQHREHAHEARAADAGRASRAVRRQGLSQRDPPVDRVRGVGRAGGRRSSTTAPTGARTTCRSPARSCAAWAARAARARSTSCRSRSFPGTRA